MAKWQTGPNNSQPQVTTERHGISITATVIENVIPARYQCSPTIDQSFDTHQQYRVVMLVYAVTTHTSIQSQAHVYSMK